ncbi:MAG TPA: HAD family hydrolase [Bacteroidales bacterium]|nr:HAD family hydrolase [Bacteroidales bacterium]
MNKALFIDRDGVINVDRVHVFKIDQFVFTEGILNLCRRYYESDYLILIITNQAGIAKGFYSENDFRVLMAWVSDEFENKGIKIAGVYHCPHHPEFTGACSCRKPEPGMILKAIVEFNLEIEECVLIGDKESDIEAGRRAGIPEKNMLLLEGSPEAYLDKLPGRF